MEPENLKKQYPNPPVFSVSWELVFNSDLEKEEWSSVIEKIENKFQMSFEYINEYEEIVVNQKIALKMNDEQEEPTRTITSFGKEFKNEDTGEEFRIGTKRLVVISKKYESFEKFKMQINSKISYLTELGLFDNLELERLGLRYINYCVLPDNDPKKLNDYFNIHLNLFEENKLAKLNISYLENISLFNFRTQYHSILYNGKPAIAIDLDCFVSEPNFSYSELLNKTDEMRNLIKRRFAESITEEFEQEVMEGIK